MELQTVSVTSASFKAFGQVAAIENVEPTAQLPGMDFWADVIEYPTTEGAIGIGFATQAARPFIQESVERHLQTPELLVAAGGDMIVIVGPPAHLDEPERLPEPGQFASFRVPEGVPILLHAGVWHWAPFAVDKTIALTVAFRKGTSADDAYVCDLPEALTCTV